MVELAVAKGIAAPPETAWRILADVERWPEWTRSVESVQRLDAGSLGVGSRVRIRQPGLRRTVWMITVWAPGLRFTWVARAPGVRVVAEHVVTPSAGGCSVELRVRYEGLLGSLAGRRYGAITARYLEMEADGLRSRCESAAGTSR